jgi:hypothetical protein
MDKVVSKIAALGIPGLVLLVAMAASGWAGGAAIVTALAVLGGPVGMLGGIAALTVLALISNALAKWGFERLFLATIRRLRANGTTVDEIRRKIEGYPISRDLKLKIQWHLDKLPESSLDVVQPASARWRSGSRRMQRPCGDT